MGTFGTSFSREIGKNTGKWVSNKIFGDSWSTPHRIIVQRERQERKAERDEAREYKLQLLEMQREERDLKREQKQREREEAQQEKEAFIQNNTKEVNEHNNYINVIQTVHRDYSNPLDWNEILNQEPPKPVSSSKELETYYREYTNKQVDEKIEDAKRTAKMSFANNIIGKYYTPKFAWLFKIPTFKIVPLLLYTIVLVIMVKDFAVGLAVGVFLVGGYFLLKFGSKDLQTGIDLENKLHELENNRETWFKEYMKEQDEAHKTYLQEKQEYQEMIDIANGVKSSDKQAFIYAINFFKPFEDLKDYGSNISFTADTNKVNVDYYVHSDEVIPKTTKRLLRKGLEVREEGMPSARFNEIYQDYVCSCILRIGKEIFALLPIDKVLINAKASVLNKATGKHEDQIIVSVLVEKNKIEHLNFDLLDPSESMSNFANNMNFKKTEGFFPVNELT